MMHDIPSTEADRVQGRRRAATLLLALDGETAALIMREMDEREVRVLAEEMAGLGAVDGAEIEGALHAFSLRRSGDLAAPGPQVHDLLERALGRERARVLIRKIGRQAGGRGPFRCLEDLDAEQIALLLQGEHTQVHALILAHLEPSVAARILTGLDENTRYEIVTRMARVQTPAADVVRQLDAMLEIRAATLTRLQPPRGVDGAKRFKTLAHLLNVIDPVISKGIIERLAREAPEDATEIQSLMFVFDDLLLISDRDMQKVLTEIDKADLALALKSANAGIAEKLLGNLSSRARDNISEEIDMLGLRPLSEVEEAQRRILKQVRAMEEKGDINIRRSGGEVLV